MVRCFMMVGKLLLGNHDPILVLTFKHICKYQSTANNIKATVTYNACHVRLSQRSQLVARGWCRIQLLVILALITLNVSLMIKRFHSGIFNTV